MAHYFHKSLLKERHYGNKSERARRKGNGLGPGEAGWLKGGNFINFYKGFLVRDRDKLPVLDPMSKAAGPD